jgi:uroporphyrinogen decarboxylase
MDCVERVKIALEHREPDRAPLDIGGTRVSGIHEIAYREFRRRLGLPPGELQEQIRYLQLPKIAEDFRSMLNVDLESVDPFTMAEETAIYRVDGSLYYTDRWQNQWRMPDGGHYFDLQSFPLSGAACPADIEKFPWPKEDSEAVLGNIQSDAELSWGAHRRAVVLGRTCPGIFEMTHVLCGHQKAMTDLALNPGLSEAIMERVLELKITYYRAAIDRLLRAGVEYFIVEESDDLGSQRGLLISRDMYRRFVKPRHTALFGEIKRMSRGRAYIGLHCCGAIRDVLDDLIESGVEILNPIQVSAAGMGDTAALKRDFGDAIVFHGGGIDTQSTLAHGTTGQVRDEVRRRMDDLSPGGGFIFAPVHSIQHDVPFENFTAMVDAYREYAGC